MLGVALRQHWLDAALTKLLAMRFRIVAEVALDVVVLLPRSAWLAAYLWDAIHQGKQFFDVAYIRRRQDVRQQPAIAHPRSPAFRMGWRFRKERFDSLPQRSGNEWFCHHRVIHARDSDSNLLSVDMRKKQHKTEDQP